MKAVLKVISGSMVCMAVAGICYLMSCTKPGNVTLPEYEPRLVLHGYVAVGDSFRIALGKTIRFEGPLASPDETFVKNGWVVLYDENVFLDSLRYDDSIRQYLTSHRRAIAGKQYIIRAGAPGFPSIEAVSIAPAPVDLVNLVRRKNVRRNSGGGYMDDLTLSFNDPVVERNFYLAVLQPVRFSNMCVYSYDPSVELASPELIAFDETNCILSDRIMYNDKTFNGTLKELTITADGGGMDPYQDLVTGQTYRATLKRHHVTEDYYRYFKVSGRPIVESGPGFFEPYMVKGNVKNGYGLFTVYSMAVDPIY